MKSGNAAATITSTYRRPEDQARAMYNNIGKKGVAHQRGLYGPAGNEVISVYERSLAAGKTRAEILADMAAAIEQIGAGLVSKHSGDHSVLGVIDIDPISIANHAAFLEAIKAAIKDRLISNFLQPPKDPAYHIEIPQR
ncbi:MAG TPA: hypothetical protein VFZ66_27170 [Herpetosiphonaceae bacterium]